MAAAANGAIRPAQNRRATGPTQVAAWAGAELAPGRDTVTADEIADYVRLRVKGVGRAAGR